MTEIKDATIKDFHVRAKLPQYFRIAALGLLGATVLFIVFGFYRSSEHPEFRMKSFPTTLSTDVIGVVNGYERREMDGDVLRYYIKADKGTTFSDNHQELENVYLEVYDAPSGLSDKITADKAVYIPEENRNFTGYFAGNVNIETRDALKVKTEQVTYKKADETATIEELVEFERENVKGKAFGAVVRSAEKKLELLKDVEITTFEPANGANAKQATVKTGYAMYDQTAETIELRDGVDAHVVASSGNSDVRSDSAIAFLVKKPDGNGRDLKKLELHGNVAIVANRPNNPPTNIHSGFALYERDIDRFDLRDGVRIETTSDNKATNITSSTAVYEQTNRKIYIDGNAEVSQGTELLKGDHIYAELYPANKLKLSTIRGNAYLRQATAERVTEVSANELNAFFNERQQLMNANATGSSRAVLTPVNATADYSQVTMTAPTAIRLEFKGEGLLEKMTTDGRTTIQLDVPGGAADAANKRVTADTVRTFLNADGKDIQRAEAVGNAELFVEPLSATPQNYRTTVTAPRFDCEFFPTGNNAKECVASTKTKTVRVPTVPADDRGTQTITADKLTAVFSQQTKDIDRFDAAGGAKFVELDRNAVASQISFTKADETVRLRGGEPTVWDSRARARATEIDWDTRNEKSYLRGGANTTYYSQKSTGGATPFGATDKPVFLTAQSAEFDHRAQTAIYTGNARGWQENNYVRGDRLQIREHEGQFVADGNVQSLLYNVRRRENGRETNAPVYVSSAKMTYNRDSRLVRYETNVDIRQGTDRILGGAANIYLDEKNELSRSEIENNVVITQPNRRAVGDYAQYTAADESVVLRGNPARVDDAENGSSSGGQMTVYLRNNNVVSEGKSKQNSTGRIRSVYKVKNN